MSDELHTTISGDADRLYVSDEKGRIIATCSTLDDARIVSAALNAYGVIVSE